MRWTPAKDDELRKLYADGHTCSTIARMIGGISRNAVIGRVHRLRLPGRPPSGGRPASFYSKMAARAARIPKPKAKPFPVAPKLPVLPIPPAAAYDVARVSFLDLDKGHCKWPVADPQEVGHDKPLFCGEPRHPGLPYCPVHCRRAFAPPQPRAREIRVRERELQVA